MFQEDYSPQLSPFPPFNSSASDTAVRPRRRAPVIPANPLQPVLTGAPSLSNALPSKNHKPNCPILGARGISYKEGEYASEGIEICENCPLPQCVFEKSFKRQMIEARNKKIRRLKERNTVNQLASRFGLSISTVNRALATANKK